MKGKRGRKFKRKQEEGNYDREKQIIQDMNRARNDKVDLWEIQEERRGRNQCYRKKTKKQKQRI